ncbi:MAG: glycosyltransferase [Candidatus Buchananbacteria bacterium]|nr:glycosyltransferase [Candidatus Buchananbacteria bacterium]
MSKIGIDARMYGKQVSGIGTYIKNITEQIFALDKNNDYYLFLLEPIFSQYQRPHDKIHKIKVNSNWYSYAEQTKFLNKLNQYKLDLMHFPHFNAPIFYNRKRIHTIHDITPKFFPGHKQKTWWRKLAYNLTIKTSFKKSAKIITISNNTKKDLIDYFQVPENKITVTYLGIEKQFKLIKNYDKIKELKAKYGITKPYLFFISAWRNHKNFEGLIKAFELLKTEHKLDYQLVLGGAADSYYPKINQTIDQSKFKNDIITPGFITDKELPLFYNAAELFVLPSFYEGFGIIGLEAMACGTPVVSSKSTCLPEIMGDAAIYFQPENNKEMAEKIYQALSDENLKNQLIARGFEQIKKYSWQKCGQATLNIYKQLLNQD